LKVSAFENNHSSRKMSTYGTFSVFDNGKAQ